jgi:methyl-accepting chemotaxis protein
VSQTLQQNAAASEELSSTSEEMSAQAIRLQESMTYFKLDFGGVSLAAKSTARKNSPPQNNSSKSTGKSPSKKQHDSDDELDKNFVRYN